MPNYPHGHPWRYYSQGCRCDLCTKNATFYSLVVRRERYANTPYDKIPHGTKNGYTNYGCRCDDCRKGIREWQRNHTPSPEAVARRKAYLKAYKARKKQERANAQ